MASESDVAPRLGPPVWQTVLIRPGFLDFLIFKLMREVREAGKRLIGVVEVCWAHLNQASTRSAICGLCWRVPRTSGTSSEAAVILQQSQALTARQDAEQRLRALDDKTFMNAAGTTRSTVVEEGATLMVYNVSERVTRRSAEQRAQGFMTAIKRGQIIERISLTSSCTDPTPRDSSHCIESSAASTPRKLTASVADHLSQIKTAMPKAVKHSKQRSRGRLSLTERGLRAKTA